MVISVVKSHLRIEKNRHWEDYTSLKKYWNFQGKYLREVIFDGAQTTTGALAEVTAGHNQTIAFLGANDIVYIKSEADLAALDGDSIWMDYVSSTGVLYENVESKLDSVTSTATEVPIGCESGTYVDAVASVDGSTITMTSLDMSAVAANTLAGWYVVASGDATDMEGNYLTILSNTAANPTVITCTAAPNANWAADNVSIQETLNNDVYRIRRIWAETESPTDNYQAVCDKDGTNLYAVITDGNSYGSAGSRYFSLSSSYKCFIGRILLTSPQRVAADGEALSHQLSITFTPKAESGQAAADITLIFDFQDALDWQPCIELEPCTEVTVKIKAVLNDVAFYEMGVSLTYLEVDV